MRVLTRPAHSDSVGTSTLPPRPAGPRRGPALLVALRPPGTPAASSGAVSQVGRWSWGAPSHAHPGPGPPLPIPPRARNQDHMPDLSGHQPRKRLRARLMEQPDPGPSGHDPTMAETSRGRSRLLADTPWTSVIGVASILVCDRQPEALPRPASPTSVGLPVPAGSQRGLRFGSFQPGNPRHPRRGCPRARPNGRVGEGAREFPPPASQRALELTKPAGNALTGPPSGPARRPPRQKREKVRGKEGGDNRMEGPIRAAGGRRGPQVAQ